VFIPLLEFCSGLKIKLAKEVINMANEYTPDLITLISEEGEEIEFEILDIIENEIGKFFVLYPYYENPEDAVNDPGEYYIFEVQEVDGEEELAEIEDDELLDKLAEEFEKRYNESFFDDEDDEE